ncbi:hypothetical protein DFH09DRAFT_1312340 [Mycena vulgaris]|nr:hypothetical protein DFH09DRAFT_1312340 [Mycena vulgaris]
MARSRARLPQRRSRCSLAPASPPSHLPSQHSSSSSHGWVRSSRTTLLATRLASPPDMLYVLAVDLCTSSSSNLSALMVHARHVKKLWPEMVALGVYHPDSELWDILDLAREVVLEALNLAAQ